MPRIRLYDVRFSRLPELIGRCVGDVVQLASYINSAQRRLLLCREVGDEGWYGTWAEVAFNLVSRTNPYITCPRGIARLEKVQVCQNPVFIQNQFYEYMDFGNGRMPQRFKDNFCLVQAYTRNNAITFTDLVGTKIIRIYTTDPADYNSNSRVMLQGLDPSGTVIRSQDVFNQVQGVFVTIQSPFSDAPVQFSQLTGIQKDKTIGNIQIFQVDPVTGVESLMLTMEPGEQVAGYRRYYFNNLPTACCVSSTNTPQNLQVTAIAKLDLVPVAVDTDYLLFQNLEAVIEECCSVRYSEMDNGDAKQMAQEKHLQAIRLLQGELVHYLGKEKPAVNFAPFGSARLGRQKIGALI